MEKEIYKILTDVLFVYKQKYMRGDKVAENCCLEQAKALNTHLHQEVIRGKKTSIELGIQKLQDIKDICVDYDGYRTIEGLKSLIDDIKDYAGKCQSDLEQQIGEGE